MCDIPLGSLRCLKALQVFLKPGVSVGQVMCQLLLQRRGFEISLGAVLHLVVRVRALVPADHSAFDTK